MKKEKNFSVVLTGGGTGGHIYPAIAVAEILKKDTEINNIFYIGCSKNPEKEIAEREGLKFYSLSVSGMPRKLSLKFFYLYFSAEKEFPPLSLIAVLLTLYY